MYLHLCDWEATTKDGLIEWNVDYIVKQAYICLATFPNISLRYLESKTPLIFEQYMLRLMNLDTKVVWSFAESRLQNTSSIKFEKGWQKGFHNGHNVLPTRNEDSIRISPLTQ